MGEAPPGERQTQPTQGRIEHLRNRTGPRRTYMTVDSLCNQPGRAKQSPAPSQAATGQSVSRWGYV
jgi:hypothetical protein